MAESALAAERQRMLALQLEIERMHEQAMSTTRLPVRRPPNVMVPVTPTSTGYPVPGSTQNGYTSRAAPQPPPARLPPPPTRFSPESGNRQLLAGSAATPPPKSVQQMVAQLRTPTGVAPRAGCSVSPTGRSEPVGERQSDALLAGHGVAATSGASPEDLQA